MRLYRVNGALPYFVGTQAEAKRDARADGCDWELVEVPTDKEGLITFLNTHGPAESVVMLSGDEEAEDIPEEGEAFFEKAELRTPDKPTYTERFAAAKQAERQTQFRTDEILDFVFDEASINQVSQIHGAIGTRFAEELKKGRLTGLLD